MHVAHPSVCRRRSDASLLEGDSKARAILSAMTARYHARLRINHIMLVFIIACGYWTLILHQQRGHGSNDAYDDDSGHPMVVTLLSLCIMAVCVITMYHDATAPPIDQEPTPPAATTPPVMIKKSSSRGKKK